MKRRSFLTLLATALTVLARPAFASPFEDEVVAQLTKQGFSAISKETTWLGRIRILAERSDGHREIVLNPRTGEILRDIWTSSGGVDATKPILDAGDGSSGKGGASDGNSSGKNGGSDGSDSDNSGSDSSGSGGSGSGEDSSGGSQSSGDSGSGTDAGSGSGANRGSDSGSGSGSGSDGGSGASGSGSGGTSGKADAGGASDKEVGN